MRSLIFSGLKIHAQKSIKRVIHRHQGGLTQAPLSIFYFTEEILVIVFQVDPIIPSCPVKTVKKSESEAHCPGAWSVCWYWESGVDCRD